MSDNIYVNAAELVSHGRQHAQDKKDVTSHLTQNKGRRCYCAMALCLGLLCVLLVAVVAVMWVMRTTERNRLNASNSNLTLERDQLQKDRDELQRDMSILVEELSKHGKSFNSHMYYIYEKRQSWSVGRQFCRYMGGDLVIINDEEEKKFLDDTFNNIIAWIGLTDAETEGVWKWVDGTALGTSYWLDGEPNNLGEEDCAVIINSAPNKLNSWNDYSCTAFWASICERQV